MDRSYKRCCPKSKRHTMANGSKGGYPDRPSKLATWPTKPVFLALRWNLLTEAQGKFLSFFFLSEGLRLSVNYFKITLDLSVSVQIRLVGFFKTPWPWNDMNKANFNCISTLWKKPLLSKTTWATLMMTGFKWLMEPLRVLEQKVTHERSCFYPTETMWKT